MQQKGKPAGLPFFAVVFHLDREWKSVLYSKALHIDTQRALDLAQVALLFRRGKRRSDSAAGGAASPADPMHKIFRDLGHIVINDVRHVVYINATGGNIGGNQDAMSTLSKAA